MDGIFDDKIRSGCFLIETKHRFETGKKVYLYSLKMPDYISRLL